MLKVIIVLVAMAGLLVISACGEEPNPSPAPPAPGQIVSEAPTTAAAPTPAAEAPMPTPEVATITGSLSPDIEADMDAAMSLFYGEFSGSLLIAKDDAVLMSKGYGMADYENAIPNTPRTVFPLGQVTLQFTAAAIMQLQEKGLLDVKAPISDYLPDYPNGESITIHHLLTHTSGIPYFGQFMDQAQIHGSQLPVEEVIDLFRDEPLEFVPGEEWSYSNSGYVLLGYLIGKLSGSTYQQYLEENFFQPFGMADTAYDRPGDLTAGRARGYNEDLTEAEVFDLTTSHGAGALASTVEDLYLWYRALNSAQLLAPDSIDMMFTPYVETVPYDIFDSGYGWFIAGANSPPYVMGGNMFRGYHAMIRIYRKDDLVIIMLGNTEEHPPSGIPTNWKVTSVLATIALDE